MKILIEFVKITLIGGLLVLLPIWLTVLLLLKAVNSALLVLRPAARLLPESVAHEDLAAFVLLLVICFVIGLMMRTQTARRFSQWQEQRIFERIPGYKLLRAMTRQLAGKKEENSFQPALVEMKGALQPAFIVEKHLDGQFTVFVSSSPTPLAGAIYILPPERVHPVDVSLSKAMLCIAKWGAGSGELLAAMRPK
jgi:uncharacterized membrane protein